jgi:hypothetical protein
MFSRRRLFLLTLVFFELTPQAYEANLIEPGGKSVPPSEAKGIAGSLWPYTGHIYDADNMDTVVGSNAELCTRLDDHSVWYCEGTYVIDGHNGCQGQITFTGAFTDETSTGKYTILGGTDDFVGAKGYVWDTFDYKTLYSTRTIHLAS